MPNYLVTSDDEIPSEVTANKTLTPLKKENLKLKYGVL